MKKSIVAYLVTKNSDQTEGRGPMVPTNKVFESKQLAEAWINQEPGIMGRRGLGFDLKEVIVYNNNCSLADVKIDEREIKKQYALNKLSKEERELLGLE